MIQMHYFFEDLAPTLRAGCLYSPECGEKLFGKSEWLHSVGSRESVKRGEKRPYYRFATPKPAI